MRLLTLLLYAATAVTALHDPAAAQNAESGKRLFEKCLACHAVGPGAQSKNGPVLNGIVGRAMGSAPGFEYSQAFQAAKAKGLVWTEDALARFLESPLAFLPKNKMAYGAVKTAGERADIIAYLKTLQ